LIGAWGDDEEENLLVKPVYIVFEGASENNCIREFGLKSL